MATKVARMMMLEKASNHVGQVVLAAEIGINERSLRAKFTADRGVSDDDLEAAARALERHAAKMLDDVRKIRAMVA
jgi:hypothetical protein